MTVRHPLARLESLQFDALRELANIGAGHAATALSLMTGQRVGISVPAVSVTPRTAIRDAIGASDEPVLVLRLSATGSFSAGLVLAFTDRDALALARLLLGETDAAAGDPLVESALKETGNVLAAAYLNALASVTGWAIPMSIPDLLRLRAEGADAALAWEGDYAVCLDTTFKVGEHRPEVHGHVLLFPQHGTLTELLRALGLLAA